MDYGIKAVRRCCDFKDPFMRPESAKHCIVSGRESKDSS